MDSILRELLLQLFFSFFFTYKGKQMIRKVSVKYNHKLLKRPIKERVVILRSLSMAFIIWI